MGWLARAVLGLIVLALADLLVAWRRRQARRAAQRREQAAIRRAADAVRTRMAAPHRRP